MAIVDNARIITENVIAVKEINNLNLNSRMSQKYQLCCMSVNLAIFSKFLPDRAILESLGDP